jgi:hydroxymethylpyrimidine pyrophosphatase-like HAD family hydrolase
VRYVVLAAGFDGTLARDGRCDPRSIEALHALTASGRKLILTTSRQLRDVLDVFPEARLFDYLVAENGAVVHCPAARESAILARAPSETLIHELRRRGVEPLRVGSVIVTTSSQYRPLLEDAIARLQLDCYVIDNGDAVTVLPVGISKATGVAHVLDELRLSQHNLVAIGDAENDLALLEFAEHGAAVANASQAVKESADRVTREAFAAGVAEIAADMLQSDLERAPTRRDILLGKRASQQRVTLSPGQCCVLVAGPPGSGKAAVYRGLLNQYVAQRYQSCIIGAYSVNPPIEDDAVAVCGTAFTAPSCGEVLAMLDSPCCSVVVNLIAIAASERARFTTVLIDRIAALHSRTGRPHLLAFDNLDGIFNVGAAAALTSLDGATRLIVTQDPERLPPAIAGSIDVVVALGETAARTVAALGGSLMAEESCTDERSCALAWFKQSDIGPFRLELAESSIESAMLATSRPRSALARVKRDQTVST